MSANDRISHVRQARAAARRPDDGQAFLPDPTVARGHGILTKTDVEFFAEEFIASATTGEQVDLEAGDEVLMEEVVGGPFLDLDELEFSEETVPEPPPLSEMPSSAP